MLLRPADDADLSFLHMLYASTRADEGMAAGWPEDAWTHFLGIQFALQHRHVVTTTGSDFLLVVHRGRLVGRFYLDRAAPIWRIVDIAFLPGHRGKGLGTALIRWAQHAAAQADAAGLDLHVLHANPAAAGLYARLGFIDAFSTVPTHRHMVWTPDRRG
jgi:GNAT superfamily N-acetyltransferase